MPETSEPERPAYPSGEGRRPGIQIRARRGSAATRHTGGTRLAALEKIATALAMTRTPEDVAAAVTRVAAKALGAVAASVRLLGSNGLLERVPEPSPATSEPLIPFPIRIAAVDLIADVMRRGTVVRVETPEDGLARYPDTWPAVMQRGVRAAIAVPMQTQGRIFGALSMSFAQPHAFTAREQDFIEAIASLTGQALDRARLLALELERTHAAEELARLRQQQAEEAHALAAISGALASTLEPGRLYAVILEQAVKVLPCDHAAVHLYEDGWAVVAASWGVHAQRPGTRIFPVTAVDPMTVFGSDGKPALIADTSRIRWIDVPPFTGELTIRSTLVVPLLFDSAVVGTFNIDSFTPNFYSQRHLDLAIALGEQVGHALRNAKLYASEQARAQTAEELARLRQVQAEAAEMLAQVSSVLASTLEPAELYRLVLSQVSRVIPCDNAAVVLYENDWVVLGANWGDPQTPPGTRMFPLSEIGNMASFSAGQCVLIRDTAEQPRWKARPPFTGITAIRSILFVPLLLDGRLVGSLNIASYTPGIYDQGHLALAARFAERVQHAMLNARLYQAEQQRARAAEALVQLREGFVASISHELRTPLTAIIGYGELLQARWAMFDDSQRLTRIGSIVAAANRLQRLVADLLLLNQLETEALVPHCLPVPLDPLVRQAVEEVQGSYVGQEVELSGPGDELVNADPDRTVQILANMVDNAAKYSPEGCPIVISWEIKDPFLVLRVRDQGAGISEQGREHLFTRFGRAPGSKVRSGHVGTGLGLYLGRLLARAMGGELELLSTGPQGSTFQLQLPRPTECYATER